MSENVLSAARVNEIFMNCLFEEEEDQSRFIKAPGIARDVGFHPHRVLGHKEEIAALLEELPVEFHEDGGGGMSFLNACVDRHGNQWADLHQSMEQLFQLGIAVGKVACLSPREMWPMLPGGVPYYLVYKAFKPVQPYTT